MQCVKVSDKTITRKTSLVETIEEVDMTVSERQLANF